MLQIAQQNRLYRLLCTNKRAVFSKDQRASEMEKRVTGWKFAAELDTSPKQHSKVFEKRSTPDSVQVSYGADATNRSHEQRNGLCKLDQRHYQKPDSTQVMRSSCEVAMPGTTDCIAFLGMAVNIRENKLVRSYAELTA